VECETATQAVAVIAPMDMAQAELAAAPGEIDATSRSSACRRGCAARCSTTCPGGTCSTSTGDTTSSLSRTACRTCGVAQRVRHDVAAGAVHVHLVALTSRHRPRDVLADAAVVVPHGAPVDGRGTSRAPAPRCPSCGRPARWSAHARAAGPRPACRCCPARTRGSRPSLIVATALRCWVSPISQQDTVRPASRSIRAASSICARDRPVRERGGHGRRH
jgi:hypothetical protein